MAFASGSWYVSSFQSNLKKEITSFDSEAWQDAVEKSGIEIVEKPDDSNETAEVDSEQKSVEVSEPDVTPVSKKPVKQKETVETVNEDVTVTEKPFSMKKPCKGDVVAECSLEELVFCEATNDWRTHNGVDFAAEEGDPIYATADGVVSHIYTDELMGTVLMLDHQNGIVSFYGNIQNAEFMKVGTAVLQGDVVGGVGKPGILEANSGMHLHFEVKCNEEYVDPMKYITEK